MREGARAGRQRRRPAHLPAHRRGEAGGNCPASFKLARIRDLVHPCKRCRELPEPRDGAYAEPGHQVGVHSRPPAPRPLKARGYCASHLREVQRAERERAADRRRGKHYGITRLEFAELLAAQGGGCACGKVHGATRRNGSPIRQPATDHDHGRQAACVAAGRHDADTCCKRCVRGALGLRCNREIVGRFTPEQLRNLADYIERPTAQRLGWWDVTPGLTRTPPGVESLP
jgi:hypothetical protein